MYFPVTDILNGTIFGIPKNDTINWDSAVDLIVLEKECED